METNKKINESIIESKAYADLIIAFEEFNNQINNSQPFTGNSHTENIVSILKKMQEGFKDFKKLPEAYINSYLSSYISILYTSGLSKEEVIKLAKENNLIHLEEFLNNNPHGYLAFLSNGIRISDYSFIIPEETSANPKKLDIILLNEQGSKNHNLTNSYTLELLSPHQWIRLIKKEVSDYGYELLIENESFGKSKEVNLEIVMKTNNEKSDYFTKKIKLHLISTQESSSNNIEAPWKKELNEHYLNKRK